MQTRRQVLRGLGVMAGSAALPFLGAMRDFALGGAAQSPIHLGAQTNAWTTDRANPDSFFAVLGQIRQVGYSGFETGFFNLLGQFDSPRDARQRIAATGLAFLGIHIALPFAKDDPTTNLPPPSLYERVARGGVALGAQHLIFSGAPAASADELRRKVQALNTAGKFSSSLGLPLAYHNHWWEFQSKIGEIEALYTQTDPALVSFVLDAGHAYRGGANVPAFLREHHDRIVGLHLRDYKDGQLVPLGEGSFPLAEVAAALKLLHWEGWALNEEERDDGTKNGLTVIDPAFRALRGAFSA
jgi:inosose dehydratase